MFVDRFSSVFFLLFVFIPFSFLLLLCPFLLCFHFLPSLVLLFDGVSSLWPDGAEDRSSKEVVNGTLDYCDPLRFSVVHSINQYGPHLHGWHLVAIPLAGDIREIQNVRKSGLADPSVGTWIKRW